MWGLTGASYGVVNDILPNPFHTSGVQNIEKRYSAGGGSKNHQTGIATGRGDHDAVVGNQETAKGIGSPHHEEHIQPQKPDVSAPLRLSAARREDFLCFFLFLPSLGRKTCFMVPCE